MFAGHFAVALAAKRVAPQASLGVLFLAAQWVDLLWPMFLLLGWEHVRISPGITAVTPLDFYDYPITHSLVTGLGWALLVGGAAGVIYKSARTGLIVGLLVISHWVLDFVTHRPDMPLWPTGPVVGLGLWFSVLSTAIVEFSLFAVGLAVYATTTKAKDKLGAAGLWLLAAFLVIIQLGAYFGPPPPDVNSLAVSALSMWLIVAWGYRLDAHRSANVNPTIASH